MNLADKITQQRKIRGWSQEELAQRLDVTRQSVSKWESAQSVPDLERIIAMSELFVVSTDYLLKDSTDSIRPETAEEPRSEYASEKEAMAYLEVRRRLAPMIALAVRLCVFSPFTLLVLSALNDRFPQIISENLAGGGGLIALFIVVAVAVYIFLRAEALTQEAAEVCTRALSPEAADRIRQEKKQYMPQYRRRNTIGVLLCILSPVPLFTAAFLTENVLLLMGTVILFLFIVGCAASLFVEVGVPHAAMERLLREGEYAPDAPKLPDALRTVYWLAAAVVYLSWSFLENAWQISWIVWVIAGILYAALEVILHAVSRRNGKL